MNWNEVWSCGLFSAAIDDCDSLTFKSSKSIITSWQSFSSRTGTEEPPGMTAYIADVMDLWM